MGIIKTTLSPLTNTTSLVSIILVILLISVFRFSGGGISTNNKEIARKDLFRQNEEFKNTNYKIKRDSEKSGVIEMDANEVNKIFGIKKTKPKEQKPKDDKESSFDSIERSLGLR